MNRYFGWLNQPLPAAKAWWLVWTLAYGIFLGTWMQAFDSADQRGVVMSWQSHVLFLTPVWIMSVAMVAMMVRHDRRNKQVEVASTGGKA